MREEEGRDEDQREDVGGIDASEAVRVKVAPVEPARPLACVSVGEDESGQDEEQADGDIARADDVPDEGRGAPRLPHGAMEDENVQSGDEAQASERTKLGTSRDVSYTRIHPPGLYAQTRLHEQTEPPGPRA